MTTAEAISRMEQLAQDGSLVWASCRPKLAGGGWAVRIIGPIGPDRNPDLSGEWRRCHSPVGHGPTLGEALADALKGLEARAAS